MEKYILAVDQGTTSTRAIIFNKQAKPIAQSSIELRLITPKSGWVEVNPLEIWETTKAVIMDCLNDANLPFKTISAMGITNQRETTVLWDKVSGKPVYNGIVWQSRQSQEICEDLINRGFAGKIKEKTGLYINPYFSASKIKWIFDNVPGVYEKALRGEILFGTIDTYLVWQLTKGEVFVTDYSNASRTLLFNIKTLTWDEELLSLFSIPPQILPRVVPSSEVVGKATYLASIDKDLNIPIAAIAGDQQASLFGQCCFDGGDVKNTYGTGCFMLMNTKTKIVSADNGLLTTIAWGLNGHVEYALEGSIFIAGAAVQWLRDGMRLIEKSQDCEIYSSRYAGSDGVYIVPAFVGLGTPYWDNDARGAVFGLTRATKKEHFINATVESIAYQSRDVMEAMIASSGFAIKSLAVDGGASCNDYLMQFQANLLDCKILRASCKETTALGVAYLAGLAVKLWNNLAEIKKLHDIDAIFMSNIDNKKREKLYNGWKKAVEATRIFKL